MADHQGEIDELRGLIEAIMTQLASERMFSRALFAMLVSLAAETTGRPAEATKELREAAYGRIDKTRLPGAEGPLAEAARETARIGLDVFFRQLLPRQ